MGTNKLERTGRVVDCQDGSVGTTKIVIPEGKWLAVINCDHYYDGGSYLPREHRVFGIDQDALSIHIEDDVGSTETHYDLFCVAEKPFAVMEPERMGFTRFSIANQTANGNLYGPKLKVRHPKFTRGCLGWRWLQLTELARFLGIESEKRLWDFYFPFWPYCEKDYGLEMTTKKELMLLVAVDSPREERFVRDVTKVIERTLSLDCIWVPAGWAMNILRLNTLGVCPR